MAERKQLSKKLRFDVFKRDGFRCMYCGAHPPSVLLHVDHVDPVANGGKNNIDNLVTACEPCNLGKGAHLLSSIPETLANKAATLAERELQLKGYHAVLEAKRKRLDEQAWQLMNMLRPGQDTAPQDWMNSLRKFIDELGLFPVLEAMEIALAKGHSSEDKAFRYFCGVCWNKLREQREGAL